MDSFAELVEKIKLDLLKYYAHRSAEEQAERIVYDVLAPYYAARELAATQKLERRLEEKDAQVKNCIGSINSLKKELAVQERNLDAAVEKARREERERILNLILPCSFRVAEGLKYAPREKLPEGIPTDYIEIYITGENGLWQALSQPDKKED